jgi:hypothetical protein
MPLDIVYIFPPRTTEKYSYIYRVAFCEQFPGRLIIWYTQLFLYSFV